MSQWSLDQLFPLCPVPTCPKYRTRHMLEHQREIATQILTGDENYIYLQGGVGSAKSLLWGSLAAAFMIMIPGCDMVLCRKDYNLLYDTLWKYFRNSLEAACAQYIIPDNPKKMFSKKTQGDYSVVKLSNGSLARAVQLKQLNEAMGPNRDFIFISDAMENENFGFIFHGEGTVGGLQSRLRGQAASFFQLPDGSVKDMRRFCVESNPPPNISELHTIFGKEPGVRNLPNSEITYRHIQISTVSNDHNPASYISEISSQHADIQDIQRILEGKTIPYYGGVKVIPEFDTDRHVHHIEVDTSLPLYISIDPGKQHPGVLFCQIKECAYGKLHFIALSEISNLYDKTTKQLASFELGELLGILPHLALFYPTYFDYKEYSRVKAQLLKEDDEKLLNYTLLEPFFENMHFCMDRAAEKEHASNKDRETDRSILRNSFGIRSKYRTNIGLNLSLGRVREAFKETCSCNIPRLIVNKYCELLIDAYSGGYRYTKYKDGSHSDKPIEDHRYEDVADAHRYCLENYFFLSGFEGKTDEVFTYKQDEPWAWMHEGISHRPSLVGIER